MAEALCSRQSQRRRGPRIRYPDDESESDELVHDPVPRRSIRTMRRVRTYRESSEEDIEQSSSNESGDSGSTSEEVLPQNGTRSRPKLPHARQSGGRKRNVASRGRLASLRSFFPSKRRKTACEDSRTESKTNEDRTGSALLNGRIPPWQELPYHVLVNIMQYASYPLYGKASRSNPSIHWLCDMSHLCRSFHEACVAALLQTPPLYPQHRAHGLISLLRQPPTTLLTNYRRKITNLDIEVKHLLIRKSGVSIAELVSLTPLVQRIRLYSNLDDLSTLIWAQPIAQRFNWSYPLELFDCLDQNGVTLKTFEWNGRFPGTLEVLHMAAQVHSRPSFSRLRDVSFLNLTLYDKSSADEVAKLHSLFGTALQQLPDLASVTLQKCGFFDDAVASMLPPSLQCLEISHCAQLTSSGMRDFLSTGGSQLTSLRLFGNQSMSLGFMADLKALCPQLQIVQVDMLYIDPTSYRDRDPLYETLFPDGAPTWPDALVQVSLENMRQLSTEAAEDFLASLVASSGQLLNLKKLNIKAILNDASWRDRAKLRQKWLPELENVFLDTAQPEVSVSHGSQTALPSSQRQSSRIANHNLRKPVAGDDHPNGGGTPPISGNGRCDFVNLVISDQRPSQDQFREDDFLDDEPSDDHEWNGRTREPQSSRYAW